MKEIKENKMRERNSTIEMLRIFAMILVVMSHCAVHGGVVSNKLRSRIGSILVARLVWLFLFLYPGTLW